MIGKVASLEKLYPSQGSTMNSVAIGKGHLKLLFNANGGLYQYSDGKNLVIVQVVFLCTLVVQVSALYVEANFFVIFPKVNAGISQTYKFYSSYNGTKSDPQVNFVISINFLLVFLPKIHKCSAKLAFPAFF